MHRIATMSVAVVYPHYVTKVEKKGRTKAELDQVIEWLTGFDEPTLEGHLAAGTTFEDFFAQARLNLDPPDEGGKHRNDVRGLDPSVAALKHVERRAAAQERLWTSARQPPTRGATAPCGAFGRSRLLIYRGSRSSNRHRGLPQDPVRRYRHRPNNR